MTRYLLCVPFLLLVTVVTQIVYVVLSDNGFVPNRTAIWSSEAVAFLGIAIVAQVAMVEKGAMALAWSAIAVSGVLNVVQAGMGLAMFGPLKEAGDAMAPAYQATLAGAFFLYFAAKLLLGAAAITIGIHLMRSAGPSYILAL